MKTNTGIFLTNLITIACLLFCVKIAQGQNNPDIKRTMHWFLGNSGFDKGVGIDFTSGQPVIDTNPAYQHLIEATASISDTCGNLLFYITDDTVWTKNHTPMQNGNILFRYNPTQAVILPQPGNDSIFYIFYTNMGGFFNGKFLYAIVNIHLNNNEGAVISKDNELFTDYATEKVAAINHCNEEDIWICSKRREYPFGNELYCWLLSSSGLSTMPVISVPGNIPEENGDGVIAFSYDGSMAAVAYVYPMSLYVQDSSYIELYHFDNCTGVFSNPIKIQFPMPYSLVFSPDNSKLYASTPDAFLLDTSYISQFDVSIWDSTTIVNSRINIASGKKRIDSFQIGTDGKIYVMDIVDYDDSLTLHKIGVINNPNLSGLACNYMPDIIDLKGRMHNLGTPYFNYSYYRSLQYDNSCINVSVQDREKEYLKSLINIYPNPTADIIRIEGINHPSTEIELYNFKGNLVLKSHLPADNKISLQLLPSGIYLLHIQYFHISLTFKIIKL